MRLAVVLIAVYAGVLAWATLAESKYRRHAAAHFGIYDAGWFIAINVLLAINVLCAMLIRFPWKRRQIGFLVTHGGILVLLIGCLMTRQAGIEAQMPIFEGQTAHRAYQDSYHFQLQVTLDRPAPGDRPASRFPCRLWPGRSVGISTPGCRGFLGDWLTAARE